MVERGKYLVKRFVLLPTFGTTIARKNRGGWVVQLERLWRCLEGKSIER